MISASHNPPEYNGIKIFDHNGQKITKFYENKIQKLIEEFDQDISFPTEEISLKTNKELMKFIYKACSKQWREGSKRYENNTRRMLWISYNLRKKNFSKPWR